MGSRAFNLSTFEVETGALWLCGERNLKGKKKEITGVWSLKISGDRISSFQSEDLVKVKGLSKLGGGGTRL